MGTLHVLRHAINSAGECSAGARGRSGRAFSSSATAPSLTFRKVTGSEELQELCAQQLTATTGVRLCRWPRVVRIHMGVLCHCRPSAGGPWRVSRLRRDFLGESRRSSCRTSPSVSDGPLAVGWKGPEVPLSSSLSAWSRAVTPELAAAVRLVRVLLPDSVKGPRESCSHG